ncbi:MAG: polysaccharide pyruvyl transferase family protein [Planctomycetaceae bacterium]|nr:polysaccharide pyruvyl transferase family protein [Planctomycetaceae bacterium]
MLCAIRQYLRELDPDIQLAVDPFFGTYSDRARHGLLSKARATGFGRASVVQRLMSPAYRRTYGLVVDEEVNAVLDAAGFAYGDQWGLRPTREAVEFYSEAKRRGQPVVLLPQAFGPFSTTELASQAKRLIDVSSLVFARDDVSFRHLQELGGPFPNVRKAPDFTSIVKGHMPPDIELPERYACIVPNIRMLDQGAKKEQQAYVGFLAECIRRLRVREIEAVFLFHDDTTDPQVADAVESELSFTLKRIREHRPEYLKGILGHSCLVIGSRFHALVGALSQAVPCIVTGWSHKYEMLVSDYGCPELLIHPSDSIEITESLLNQLLSTHSRSAVVTKLREHGCDLNRLVREMFSLTAEVIGLVPKVVCA